MTPEERVVAHEAGHLAACLILGVDVWVVDTIGDEKHAGYVTHTVNDSDPASARDRMLVILCGMLEGADDWDDMPTWPLRTDRSTDEKNLHHLAEMHGLDERAYNSVELDAINLTLRPDFRQLVVATCGVCDFAPRFGTEMVDRIRTIAKGDRP